MGPLGPPPAAALRDALRAACASVRKHMKYMCARAYTAGSRTRPLSRTSDDSRSGTHTEVSPRDADTIGADRGTGRGPSRAGRGGRHRPAARPSARPLLYYRLPSAGAATRRHRDLRSGGVREAKGSELFPCPTPRRPRPTRPAFGTRHGHRGTTTCSRTSPRRLGSASCLRDRCVNPRVRLASGALGRSLVPGAQLVAQWENQSDHDGFISARFWTQRT